MFVSVLRAGLLATGVLLADAPEPVPSYGWMLAKTLLALVFVCVLAYVLLRWGLPRLFRPGPTGRKLELLGRLPLEGRRAVYLVRVLDKAYVLAAGEGGMEVLDELPAERARQALAGPGPLQSTEPTARRAPDSLQEAPAEDTGREAPKRNRQEGGPHGS